MNGKNMNAKTMEDKKTGNSADGKKKFPMGWLLVVVALSVFLGYFWSYIPVFHGIVSLFVFSKFLAGLCGTHFLQ